MDGHTGFGDAGSVFGFAEGPLDAIAAHGQSGRRALLLIASGGGEEPGLVTVGFPGGPEQRQGIFGQGDLAVFSALASVDMAQ